MSDAKHHIAIVRTSLLACAVLIGIATPSTITHAQSPSNETIIDAQVCSGGAHTGSYDLVSPTNNQTLASPSTTIVGQAHWLTSVIVSRDGTNIGSFNGSYVSDEAANINIPLVQGANNLTITSKGGCPDATSTQTLSITYLSAAATMQPIFTNKLSPGLTGTVGNPNVRIFLIINGGTYEATNNGDGTWTLPADSISPKLADGYYDVQIYTTEGSDPTHLADTTIAHGLIVDSTPPTIDTSVRSTSSRSPELHGNVDDPTADIMVAINGTTYHAKNNGDGTWTLPAGTIKPQLASGDYSVNVHATDRASNTTDYLFTLHVDAPHELLFILPPNTGYLRIGSVNIPTIALYLGVGLLLIIVCIWRLRSRPATTSRSES